MKLRGLLIVPLAGCGLFPNVGDLVGSPDGSVDASVVDAWTPSDGPAADTSATPDSGGGDAGVDGGSPCVGSFLFCADFDKVTHVYDGWSNNYSQGATMGALDMTDFVSPPASFVAAMTGPSDAGGSTYWDLDETLNMAIPSVLTLDFDVRVDVLTTLGLTEMDALEINLGDYAKNDLQIVLQIEPSGATQIYTQKSVGGTVSGANALGPLPSLGSKWSHVQLRVTQGSPPVIDLFYDGTQVLTAGALPSGPHDPIIDLAMGITYMSSASAAWKLEYDNVLLR